MSNGSVKIKVRENSKPNSLITSLDEIFPDSELLTKFNKSLGSSKFYIIALFINRWLTTVKKFVQGQPSYIFL